ncbi:MAG: hypothetical protein R2882_08175 [Gemmatimonadales bacterium]
MPGLDAIQSRAGRRNNRGNYYLSAVARLRPGLTLAQAQARLDAIADRQAPEYPNFQGPAVARGRAVARGCRR